MFKDHKRAEEKWMQTALEARLERLEKRRATGRLRQKKYIQRRRDQINKYLAGKEPQCDRCGYKKVPDILEVHHLDKNTLNNNKENLTLLCPNCHRAEHYLDRFWRIDIE